MHPDTELTGYVTDALPPAGRARVAAHLDACADCRRAVEESRAVLADLATGVPAPPPIDWGRYRADLRARVQAGPRRAWWARSMPAVLAAGVATVVLLLAIIFLGMAKMILDVAYGTPIENAEPAKETLALVAGPLVLAMLVLMLGLYLPAPLRAVLGQAARALGGVAP